MGCQLILIPVYLICYPNIASGKRKMNMGIFMTHSTHPGNGYSRQGRKQTKSWWLIKDINLKQKFSTLC